MKLTAPAAFAFLLLSAGRPAAAFSGHVATEGPLTLTIGEVEDVTAPGAPREVRVILRNAGGAPLAVRLRMAGLVDEWRAVGPAEQRLDVPAGGQASGAFGIAAGRGACSALYPVHVYATFTAGGQPTAIHAVQVFRSRFPKTPPAAGPQAAPPLHVVPDRGGLDLAALRTQRVVWQYDGRKPVQMPPGWQGSDEPSGAHFAIQRITRGATMPAITMHPPWKGGAGTILAEYRLKLPDAKPLVLRFANAIRDHGAGEPASDGVTFRVWARDASARDFEKLFDRHTDSKTWVDGQADLGKLAGKEIVLRLESDPGPKRDTTCDSSFWGQPTVIAGEPPAALSDTQREALRRRARQAVAAGKAGGEGEFVFPLAGGQAAAIVPGPAGLADGAIAFGKGERCVVFDGMRMAVLGRDVGRWPSELVLRLFEAKTNAATGKAAFLHRCRLNGEDFDLLAEAWAEGGGLRLRFDCLKRVTALAVGPADRKAPRVFYGHGYCLVEPQAFRAGFGGHNLSTSHVGFDFDGGPSLLMATNHPPDFLEVDPARRLYALQTHLDATLTFVPSERGAFDCAIRYRPLYDKPAAGGFRRKAGRFVFDIWGGRYVEIADTMKRMIAYGLTDSLLTVHVWQRWGYDYRLPDIYPPDPGLGTVEDMRKIASVCRAADIPWGLHDNYIDFYPDAEGYSYDRICFTEGGEPIPAWLNEGREAQSYRWRPDRFLPFLQRNLRFIKEGLAPTHYFIDVFTSIGPFDYYDKGGGFHSMLETRRCWGEAFAGLRDYLGGDAPTTSEAGHDQLTGWLDGADCQFLQLSPGGREFCNRAPCADWQRTPWFDAVLHDRFSLHGVGYSNRYEGGRSRLHHGIESDDYISAELLTGHALMIDRGAFGRGAVRKYWLAQDFIRSIATEAIASVQFADGDIHRQVVTWGSGAKVYANRGEEDWAVAGRTLPPFGYYAAGGTAESGIERIGGIIAEWSRGPSGLYVNGRGFDAGGALRLRPTAERVEHLGGGRFRLVVSWQADSPAPKDLAVFLHFVDERKRRGESIAFQGDFVPSSGTSTWAKRVTAGADRAIQVPADSDAKEYSILIGLWDPQASQRYPLLGTDAGGHRYLLGRLVVERSGGKVTDVRLARHEPAPEPAPRWNVEGKAIDFGPVVTTGAVRCQVTGRSVLVTPLPDVEPFDVAVRIDRFAGRAGAKVRSIEAVAPEGNTTGAAAFQVKKDLVSFRTRKGEFAYRITWVIE